MFCSDHPIAPKKARPSATCTNLLPPLRPRYYSPVQGRFLTFDDYEGRLEEPITLHKYLYAGADPVNNVDPSGQAFSKVGLMIATGIGALIGAIAGGTYARFTGTSIWKGVLVGAGIGAVTGAAFYLTWAVLGGVQSNALHRFIWDPRSFKTISRQYWQQFGPASGRSLHHWLIPQRWTWIPQGIRNAGFNVLQMPKLLPGPLGLNQWMGFALRWGGQRMVVARLADAGVRVLIPASGVASYHVGRWVGNELVDFATQFPDGSTVTPLQLTPEEERQLQDDAGRALQEELEFENAIMQ